MRALEKTPADRFQTMKEFAERLSEAEAEAAVARTAAAAGVHGGAARVRRDPRLGGDAAAPDRRGRGGAGASAEPGQALVPGRRRRGARARRRGRHLDLHAPLGGAAGASPGAGDALDPTHIAVLYFEQRGGIRFPELSGRRLTEALIHELSGVEGLQVISSNGVRP